MSAGAQVASAISQPRLAGASTRGCVSLPDGRGSVLSFGRSGSSAIGSDDQRIAIRSLAENVPAVWRSPAAENSDRRRIVRLLVEHVDVVVQGTTDRVDVCNGPEDLPVATNWCVRLAVMIKLPISCDSRRASRNSKGWDARTPRSPCLLTMRGFSPRIKPRGSTKRSSGDWPRDSDPT